MNKQLFFSILLLFFAFASRAENLQKGEAVLFYSLPKTVLQFQVTVTEQVEKPGPFYRYAERFLGTTDVITKEKTTYAIRSITLDTRTEADTTRCYKIDLTASDLSTIHVDEHGILCAINCVPETTPPATPEKDKKLPTSCRLRAENTPNLIPYGEEQIQANSIAKMAEGMAQQIYRIRESRLAILTADVDQLPADGSSLRLMLRRLDQEEKRLCQLFTGTTATSHTTHTVSYDPVGTVDGHVLFRLSALSGFVPSDDLSGSPVYLNIDAHHRQYTPVTEKDKKFKPEVTDFYYNLPGSADITLTDGTRTFLQQHIAVPQFGIAIPLPQKSFDKMGAKAQFCPKTGTIIRYTPATTK